MFAPEQPVSQLDLPAWMGEVPRLAPLLSDEPVLSWACRSIPLAVWSTGRFQRQLAPALSAAHAAAAQGDIEDLLTVAARAAALWPEAERERSLTAGRQLLECVHGARGHEAYLSLRDRWLRSGRPAWYHAVLAARAAFLHQPLATLLCTYAWREWRCLQPSLPAGRELESLLSFDETAGSTIASLIAHELSRTQPGLLRRRARSRGLSERSSHEG